ncbi:probable aspartic proteinase GIP2 [Gastrolobium bilobum]|uniref:probable aspartic proteinase GIP2 n=1 Tax=Gastrolobium bilobum TaxID=150636 RepID=UPI002AB1F221|nr:probable aspartic proteinase GIP2 [Gastrolobium bilobum]
MASFSLFLLLCFSSVMCFVCNNICHAQSSSFVLPVTKDDETLQYLTTLSYGTPFVPTKLVLDLGGPLLWVDCASTNTPSSSLLAIPHRSIQCLTAKSHDETEPQTWLSNPVTDQDQPCQILAENSITGKKAMEGELVEDLVALKSTEESKSSKIEPTHKVFFTCSPTLLFNGLASGARGMLGLGKSRRSFSSQIFYSFSTQRKITLCLSSSSGFVLFGSMTYEPEILRSLTFTPLVTDQNKIHASQEYFINVNSIKIGGKKVSFNQDGNGGTQLSSVVPYTTMQSSIYANFESAYLKAAMSMNMTRVPSVAPFGLCFSSHGIGSSQVGPNVPVIELVLQSEMVKWSIYGRNSMVRVSNEVVCLGFLDGGVNPRNPIVIGGYQLEDVLMQFDFDTSMLGFSSSLLMRHTSCSGFRIGSMPAQSL